MTTLDDTDLMEDDADEETLDLRFVSETQIACSGIDLCDMLNCDDGVTPELYKRLSLTAHKDTSYGYELFLFDEIEDEKYYLITFPSGTDFTDFSMKSALMIEEFSEKCFNDLERDDSDMACDGDCDNCPQDCIGKQPVLK